MKIAIVTFSGFTETEREQRGMDTLQQSLYSLYRHEERVDVLDVRPWKHDTDGLAAMVKREGYDCAIILAYSHGAGYAAPRFARELLKLGVRVPLVCLCDPVYRPQWLPRWTLAQILSFRALIPRSAVITFPAGVGLISGVRQHNNIPQGHKVRIGSGRPFDMMLINRRDIEHSSIDDSPEWHALAVAEVESVVRKLFP